MPSKIDERLIILLPPDLLEQVRRAAEAEDLSVSQIVRRAPRNELKAIADRAAPNTSLALTDLARLLTAAEDAKLLHLQDSIPGIKPDARKVAERLVAIAQAKARERK
jgi:hypothetical protein